MTGLSGPENHGISEVLIVSYRRSDVLRNCLASVHKHLPNATVRVWDNASEGSAHIRELSLDFPQTHWHFHESNIGFGAAVNALMNDVDPHSPSVLLLNPDAVLMSNLAGCHDAVTNNPSIAAAAPRLEGSGKGHRPWDNAHREPGPIRQLYSYAGLSSRRWRPPFISSEYATPPRYVSGYLTGACLVINPRVWRITHGFDERYFLYGEEADWARRCRRAGFRLVFINEPGARHDPAGTVSDDESQTSASSRHLAAARVRYISDHHGALGLAVFRVGKFLLETVQGTHRRRLRDASPWIITTPNLHMGGAEKQRVALANELSRRGMSAELRALKELGPVVALLQPAVKLTLARLWSVRPGLGYATMISGTTLVEVVHAFLWRLGHPRGRWLVADHVPPNADGRTIRRRQAWFVRRSDGVIYLAESQRSRRSRHQPLDSGKYWIIPNGIDTHAMVREHVPAPDERLRIVAIARLEKIKGLDIIIRAAARVECVTLDIWGVGPLRDELAALIPAADASRIRLRGLCEDVPTALSRADLFAMPSHGEGQPLAIIEAMAAGVPVAHSGVDTLPELLPEGAGFTVKPNDHTAWSELFSQLAVDRDCLVETRRRAQERAFSDFSVTAMTDKYLKARTQAYRR